MSVSRLFGFITAIVLPGLSCAALAQQCIAARLRAGIRDNDVKVQ